MRHRQEIQPVIGLMYDLVALVMPALTGLFEIPVFTQVLASTLVLAFTMFLIEYIFKVDI